MVNRKRALADTRRSRPPRGRGENAGATGIYPVSPTQQTILAMDASPECRDDVRQRWVLAHATLVRPRVDMRRLRRAYEKLLARHDSLRIRFEPIRGQWRALIGPAPAKAAIREVDLGDLDDAAFQTRVTEIANAPMPLLGHALAELVVLRCGGRGDVVVWRVHHAITDGIGMVVLVEDLLKFLIGMPIPTPALSHGEYIARFIDLPADRAAEIDAFWRDTHRDLPKAPNIGRKAKGLDPLWTNMGDVVAGKARVNLNAPSMARLEARAQRSGLRATSLLFAGFLEALGELYGVDHLAYTTLLGRSDPALASYAGAHYFDPVLSYRALGETGLDRAAASLQTALALANAHLPAEAACEAAPYETGLIEAGIYPRQFSVHQPRPTGRLRSSIFGAGMTAPHGVAQRLGPYTLTSLDVSVPQRSRYDLRFALADADAGGGFDLQYDAVSYTDAEIEAISARICALLELDRTG